MYVESIGMRESSLPFPLIGRGKVRDTYDLGEDILIVATDRMSAFDRVLDRVVRDKGRVLTAMSDFWMERLADVVPNHLVETDARRFPKELAIYGDLLDGRAVIAKKAKPLPLEFIVRGYITGSAWESYKKTGMVNGVKMPEGLIESQKLPEPMFTPSTKAAQGEHDENVSVERAKEIAGADIVEKAGKIAVELYKRADEYAKTRGIIIADTKFEFGLLPDGTLIWIDEALTPDSSRFWDAGAYEPGKSQKSFDKQPLRDWIKENGSFDVPLEVMEETSRRYKMALERITGRKIG